MDYYYARKFDQFDNRGGRQHRMLDVIEGNLIECAARVCRLLGRNVLPKDVAIVKWSRRRQKAVTVVPSEIADG